ncbi:hypothetical protein [Erwinia sp. V71]|uniref:hypothetical protein n=1 Tax=Erwinia sp. V71 TaxID=3369424 RepID=UPI003F612E0E
MLTTPAEQTQSLSKEEREASLRQVAAMRFIYQQPVRDLSVDTSSDPFTAEDAATLAPLLDMTTDTDSINVFATALNKVLRENNANADNIDNSDTSQAVSLAMTQAKLNKLVEKYVSSDNQQQAGAIVTTLMNSKFTEREDVQKDLAQATLKIAQKYGSADHIAQAESYLQQVEQGTSRAQQELTQILQITAQSSNMDEAFAGFAAIVKSNGFDSTSQNNVLKQLDAYQAQWQSFIQSLA